MNRLRTIDAVPQFLGNVRRKGGQQLNQGIHPFCIHCRSLTLGIIEGITQFHQLGNRRIELIVSLQILRDFLNRRMDSATQVFLLFG